MIEIKKHFPKLWWSIQVQELRDKRERLYKVFRKTNRQQHLILWKKVRADFKILAQKNKKEIWEKISSSLNSKTPINQAWNRVRQLKGKNPKKKFTILEVSGAQYKDRKNIANKIDYTFAEISLLRITTPPF